MVEKNKMLSNIKKRLANCERQLKEHAFMVKKLEKSFTDLSYSNKNILTDEHSNYDSLEEQLKKNMQLYHNMALEFMEIRSKYLDENKDIKRLKYLIDYLEFNRFYNPEQNIGLNGLMQSNETLRTNHKIVVEVKLDNRDNRIKIFNGFIDVDYEHVDSVEAFYVKFSIFDSNNDIHMVHWYDGGLKDLENIKDYFINIKHYNDWRKDPCNYNILSACGQVKFYDYLDQLQYNKFIKSLNLDMNDFTHFGLDVVEKE